MFFKITVYIPETVWEGILYFFSLLNTIYNQSLSQDTVKLKCLEYIPLRLLSNALKYIGLFMLRFLLEA